VHADAQVRQLDGHKRMLKNVLGLGRSHQPNQFHFCASNSLTHFKYLSIRSHVLIAVGVFLREKGKTKKPLTSYKFFSSCPLQHISLQRSVFCRGQTRSHCENSAFEAQHSQQLQQAGAAAEMLTICAGLQSLQLLCFF
jgi:hypothetical protein